MCWRRRSSGWHKDRPLSVNTYPMALKISHETSLNLH